LNFLNELAGELAPKKYRISIDRVYL